MLNNKYIKKFQEKHNWSEYCSAKRKERIARLKKQGVLNPWYVIQKGVEPRYVETNRISNKGRLTIPVRIRRQLGIKGNEEVIFTVKDDKSILLEIK